LEDYLVAVAERRTSKKEHPMSNETISKPRSNKRKFIIGGIVAAIGLSGVLGAQAFTNSRIGAHLNIENSYSAHQGKMWKTGWRSGGHGFGELTAEQREQMIVRMVKHLAVEIDATDAQQSQLVDLIKDFTGEILPMRQKMMADKEKIVKLLTASSIDRNALEALRVNKLADAETMSKKFVDVVADAAEILTTEQRNSLADRIETFGKMRGGWKH
jgi:Spy/CpxP family protein refolding chaperone